MGYCFGLRRTYRKGSTSSLLSVGLSLNKALNPLPSAFFLLISTYRFCLELVREIKVANRAFTFSIMNDHGQSKTR